MQSANSFKCHCDIGQNLCGSDCNVVFYGLNFDGIILKIFLAVAIVVRIDSERIYYLLAIRNNQYMLLQFRIGKCVIVGLSIAYGVFFAYPKEHFMQTIK